MFALVIQADFCLVLLLRGDLLLLCSHVYEAVATSFLQKDFPG
jgi:hypothetical protein